VNTVKAYPNLSFELDLNATVLCGTLQAGTSPAHTLTHYSCWKVFF